jgi:hypothetical protein
MNPNRRELMMHAAIVGAIAAVQPSGASGARAAPANRVELARRSRNSIGVSTYSLWQFRGQPVGIAECINHAAALSFDGVEILHV